MQQKEIEKINKMANAVRFLSLDMITKAKSGHPGLPMGTAELATTLFAKHLKFSPLYPKWENRDRFILSAGHGSALLYSLLHFNGYSDITLDDIKNFRTLGSKTAGHPEYGNLLGIETTTGPLGQGIATSVGIAIAEKVKQAKLSPQIIDNKVYVLAGDGCLMEGISEEAISLAGTLKLNNLIVIWDDNNITIDGNATIANTVDMKARFKANNWNIFEIKNAYDIDEIDSVLTLAKSSDKPAFIDAHTVIGKGYTPVENSASVHGTPLTEDQVIEAKKLANYPTTPFEIPSEVLEFWSEFAIRNNETAKTWFDNVEKLDDDKKDFIKTISGSKKTNIDKVFEELKEKFASEKYEKATRNANGAILEYITPYIKNLIGGTADLCGPTCVKTTHTKEITAQNFDGNFIHFGIREHEMSAAMNGLCLSGFKAFGSTFFTFLDYLKPALRLSALMHLAPVYVFTHDSFLIGEDGPTHQPIEHLVSLRSMPNINVIRPADAIESVEAWQIAIAEKTKPTAIMFSRQSAPMVRDENLSENMVAKGAYVISDFAPTGEHLMTIIATGTEVYTAIKVQKIIREKHGINSRVVSMPSMNLFDIQSDEYKESVIAPETITVSIEAGSTFGWSKYAEINIGIDTFGASAPAEDLRKHFGFTPEQIAEKIMSEISK